MGGSGQWISNRTATPFFVWKELYPITSDSRNTGSFGCDDKRLEQIYKLVHHAVESDAEDFIPRDSTGILAVRRHHLFYGDKKIIEDNYGSGKKYLDYLKTKVTGEGFICHGLGDQNGSDKNTLCRENVETAFLYADAMALAEFAEILGMPEEQEEFLAYAKQVRDNYNEKLLIKHPTEGFWCYRAWDHTDEVFMSQVCEAMPLYFGMVPEDKKKDVEKAFAHVLKRDNAFVSGKAVLPYIIRVMTVCNMHDKIVDFILRGQHPGFLEWYYNGIAGIWPLKPGFAEIRIKPYLPKTATYFHCKFKSVNGTIEVRVQETSDKIVVEATIPEGIAYQVDDSLLKRRREDVEWIFYQR